MVPAGGELGIRKGEYWAFRPGTTRPWIRALILDPGARYESSIRIRLDDQDVTELWTRRAKLPCRWADLDRYLIDHPEERRDRAAIPEPRDDGASAINAQELRSLIHDEVAAALGVKKLAYTYAEAAVAVGYSPGVLREAVRRNELLPSFANTKPVFTEEELRRWLRSLPTEPPS